MQIARLWGVAASLVLSLAWGCSDDDAGPGPAVTTGATGGVGASPAGGGGGGGLGAGGAGGEGGVTCAGALQVALDEVRDSQTIPGISAEVRARGCDFSGASGMADLGAMTPVEPADVFRVGSITKTFVAATLVKLETEGLLSLDDTIETHLPGLLPDGGVITVRQVLNHTSGLYNYTDHPDFFPDAIADPTKVWPPEELVAYATGEPLDFAPGTAWSYSNTGYIVAGMVVEAVTGNAPSVEIRARVLEPAGLTSTFLAGEEAEPAALVHGYADSGASYTDITSLLDPSAAWTAGALVSTTADLTSFYEQLLEGDLLTAAERTSMTTWVSDGGGGEYGLGLLRQVTPYGELIGHGGSIWGFQSLAVRLPEEGESYTILINSSTDSINPVFIALADVAQAN